MSHIPGYDDYVASQGGETAAAETENDMWTRLSIDGASFVFNAPDTPPAVWGDGEDVAWAQGEALMLCGPPGVGKTTLANQLVAGRLGIGDKVLGMPMRPSAGKVLYLAMDRPPQIARAMARLFKPEHRDVLEANLVVWKGPPPYDIAKRPDTLAKMCDVAKADTVIVDSLKDAALKLSDDEVGSGYNRARQKALVEGVEVLELHHQRKASGDNKKPSKLDDVYGSAWLTAGAGSVMILWGEAGDPIVDLMHIKQPMSPIGPYKVLHDHSAGTSEIYHQVDLLAVIEHAGKNGLTAKAAAVAMFDTDKPDNGQTEKARRKLEGLVRSGHLTRTAGFGQKPATYFRLDLLTDLTVDFTTSREAA